MSRQVHSLAGPGAVLLFLVSVIPAIGSPRGELLLAEGHSSDITCLAVSPDGSTLASGGQQGEILLWSAEDGALLRTLTGHEEHVSALAFSADGSTLVSGGLDNQLRFWDLGTGLMEGGAKVNNAIRSMAVAPDDRWIALGGSDGVVYLLESGGGRTLELKGHELIPTAMFFSSQSDALVSGDADGVVILWDLKTPSEVKRLPQTGSLVAASPDLKLVALVRDDGTTVIVDLVNEVETATLDGRMAPGATLGENGGPAAVFGGQSLKLFDLSSQRLMSTYSIGAGTYDLTLIAPEAGRLFVTRKFRSIEAFDLATGEKVFETTGREGWPYKTTYLELLPGSSTLVAAGAGRMILVFDFQAGAPLHWLEQTSAASHTQSVYGLAVSRDGARIASAGDGLKIWDAKSGALQTEVAQFNSPANLAFSPDGRYIAGGGSKSRISIMNADSGEEVLEIHPVCSSVEEKTTSIRHLAFLSEGGLLAASDERCVYMLDPATGETLHAQPFDFAPRSLAAAPNGSRLAFSRLAGANTEVVEVVGAKEPGSGRLISVGNRVADLSFSPEGDLLAVGGEIGLTQLWDMRSFEAVQTFVGAEMGVEKIRMADDGEFVAVLYSNGEIRLWEAASGAFRAALWIFPDGEWLYYNAESLQYTASETADQRFMVRADDGSVTRLVELRDELRLEPLGQSQALP